MRPRTLAVVGLVVTLIGACSTGGGAATPVELTVLGAASLKSALDAMKVAYEAANPGTTLVISTDSSTALETQIEQGAVADVFLSADTSNPRKLVDGGFASGAVDFAGNKLTIIVPTDNPGEVMTPADLAKAGLKIIAAGDNVPVTKYTTQLIDKLAVVAGYPADFAAAYAANVASREENVNGIVTRIETGEGDAGIVYVTDASASDSVTRIDIVPESANVTATYAGVVVKASPNQDAATAFLDWVVGPEGQAILATFGFQPPTP